MVIEDALRTRPDDVAAWHAYSEHLLERGDARGTLIRLEQSLARTRPADRPGVRQEIADLVARHENGWDDGLPDGARVLSRRHGFAAEVAVEWSDGVREIVEQVLRAPFVTTLRITTNAEDERDDDEEERDEEYNYAVDRGDPRPGRQDLGVFAGLDLGRLTELDLAYVSVGYDGAQTLAATFASDRLRALDLRYCRVADTGLAALAACPRLGGLRRLHLQRNRLTAEGVRHLHRFTELTELDLRYNDLGADGARALVAAPFAGALERLWLYDSDVGRDGVATMAQAASLPASLRSLWRCV
ncbi:hypothetical protein GCM10009850_057240 [Nonomuraea monospora]|uniref:Uncharacterized protein n=2 Tax=Nonomuraea monospora TaxID=568818 RepID=A0ABN3CLB9_9ACTN